MRRRLLAGYLTISALTLVMLAVPLGRTFAMREQERALQDLERDAAVVASLSEDAVEGRGPLELADFFGTYRRDHPGRIVVLDQDGIGLADSELGAPVGVTASGRPGVGAALSGRRVSGRERGVEQRGDVLWVVVPISSSGVVHGAVMVTSPATALDDRVHAAWWGLAGLAALVLGSVTVVGLILSRAVSRPVAELRDAAARLGAGDLTARAPVVGGPPELRELAEVFNASAARQQELLESQRAFVADASHQIRTPLAALRLQLENVESEAPLSLQPAVARARAEVSRLGHLSEALLALTRATATEHAVHPTDLATVVRDRHATWEPIAHDAGTRLELELAPGAGSVLAVAGALEQIIDNLVDNAVEASPPEGVVHLVTAVVDDSIELHVLDEGPGLSDAELERATDRFWRGRDAPHGGTGLGLAIAAQLAASCGGALTLGRRPTGGLDASVRLRAAPGGATGEVPSAAP